MTKDAQEAAVRAAIRAACDAIPDEVYRPCRYPNCEECAAPAMTFAALGAYLGRPPGVGLCTRCKTRDDCDDPECFPSPRIVSQPEPAAPTDKEVVTHQDPRSENSGRRLEDTKTASVATSAAGAAQPSPGKTRDEGTASCHDCGRKYGEAHGFPDLIVQNDVWRRISPSGDDGGLLCPSCILKRVAALGFGTLSVPAAFMSGPLKSVDPDLMHAMRWIENLRQQGHGWSCPTCGDHRDRALSSPPRGESTQGQE